MSLTRLPAIRLQNFNEALLSLYHEPHDQDPVKALMNVLLQIVPHAWMSVDEISRNGIASHRAEHNRAIWWPKDHAEVLTAVAHTNPLIAVGFLPAVKLSDLCTLREFRQTAYFSDFFGSSPSLRDQAALVVKVPGGRLGFCMSHECPFSAEDILLLELLQPHFQNILNRARQYLKLPADPPLTPREREVLHWLAEGKRDAEIAAIVQAKERTVKQHVRAILHKLSVETRTAAAAAAWRARLPQGGPNFHP
ncbi:DNA-binding NarL/FixJ family response regulator [Roseimicrobium gellanilyticum]|uniref:DNA-binding NarL/FixJ family response regulator n=1 Tax=Roseimicrobium gellanilyticum TaxID=748857 RepID=A0A366H7T2_9BACT|nr:LuxR family transcriptional regulator [Roseimicrobium gellanilyticum]RBP38105.1 DNA-binding NarL/FixJ family response regulator [Roseimicrobium gellanilyticum]